MSQQSSAGIASLGQKESERSVSMRDSEFKSIKSQAQPQQVRKHPSSTLFLQDDQNLKHQSISTQILQDTHSQDGSNSKQFLRQLKNIQLGPATPQTQMAPKINSGMMAGILSTKNQTQNLKILVSQVSRLKRSVKDKKQSTEKQFPQDIVPEDIQINKEEKQQLYSSNQNKDQKVLNQHGNYQMKAINQSVDSFQLESKTEDSFDSRSRQQELPVFETGRDSNQIHKITDYQLLHQRQDSGIQYNNQVVANSIKTVSINAEGCTLEFNNQLTKQQNFGQVTHDKKAPRQNQKFSQSEIIPAESLQINIAFPVFRYDSKNSDSQSIIEPSTMFTIKRGQQSSQILQAQSTSKVKLSQFTPSTRINLKPKNGFGQKKNSSENGQSFSSSTGSLSKLKFNSVTEQATSQVTKISKISSEKKIPLQKILKTKPKEDYLPQNQLSSYNTNQPSQQKTVPTDQGKIEFQTEQVQIKPVLQQSKNNHQAIKTAYHTKGKTINKRSDTSFASPSSSENTPVQKTKNASGRLTDFEHKIDPNNNLLQKVVSLEQQLIQQTHSTPLGKKTADTAVQKKTKHNKSTTTSNQIILEYLNQKPGSQQKRDIKTQKVLKQPSSIPPKQKLGKQISSDNLKSLLPNKTSQNAKSGNVVRSILIPYQVQSANKLITQLAEQTAKQRFSKTFHINQQIDQFKNKSGVNLVQFKKNSKSEMKLPSDQNRLNVNTVSPFLRQEDNKNKDDSQNIENFLYNQKTSTLQKQIGSVGIIVQKQPQPSKQSRRISVNYSKQKLFSLQNSRSNSSNASYNLKEDQETRKVDLPSKDDNNSATQGIITRKFANSLVGDNFSSKQILVGSLNMPLNDEKLSLKPMARSLLSQHINQNISGLHHTDKKKSQNSLISKSSFVSSSKKKQSGIEVVSVKYTSQLPLETNPKAKSFIQNQIVRDQHGPGALIAMSNRQSIVENNQIVQYANPGLIKNEPSKSDRTKNLQQALQKQPKKGFNILYKAKESPAKQVQQNQASQVKKKQNSQIPKAQYKQPKTPVLIEERIDTQISTVTDQNLTPRSKINAKLQRKIRQTFQKAGQPPETQCEFYKIGKVMGKGAFGKVNLAIHRLSGKFVALKSINKQFMTEEASKRKVMQEFNILRRTRHDNIVRLYESFETPQHIVFVMEVCGGGDLLTYVRRRRKLREDVARHLFRQIITGINYCHTKSVLHRDIKLDNILLTSQGTVKICDFGVSKLLTRKNETMFEQCGTPAYIAPEVFENKGYEGFQSDIWSAGVVLYAMLYGTVPFKASNMQELHKQVVRCKPDYKDGADQASPNALKLLKSILEKDPNKRLTPAQILDHPWMESQKHKVNVFSSAEKQTIMQEFEHYNQRKERLSNDQDSSKYLPTDPFAEQLLVSTQNSGLKNASSRSVILAPFNSTLSDEVIIQQNKKQMKELMMPRRVIRFAAKVKEFDRQYEMNNNAELDNGVYHNEEEDGGNCNETKQSYNEEGGARPSSVYQKDANLATSFGKHELQSQLGDLAIESEELENSLKNNSIEDANDLQFDQSEWKQMEQKMLNEDFVANASLVKQQKPSFKKNKGPEGDENSYEDVQVLLVDDITINDKQKNQKKDHASTIAIIESFGYPEDFILESLKTDQLNYATAFYNLVTSQFEY